MTGIKYNQSMKDLLHAFFLLIFVFTFHSCYWDNEEDLYPSSGSNCDTTQVTYSGTIAPIMSTYCNSCHNTATANGGVITDTWTGLSTVVNNGKLYNAVNWVDGVNNMPQGGQKLSDCNLAKINKWIADGAPDN
jgi:hypothetical protein